MPVAEAYCTDRPPSERGVSPPLNTSMKSALNGAPVLPPPPYTWLTTRSGDAAAAGDGPVAATTADANRAATGTRPKIERIRLTNAPRVAGGDTVRALV